MSEEQRRCDGCGEFREDVLEAPGKWLAWGRNAFDFAWQRDEHPTPLCEDCEEREYRVCEDCGWLVSVDYYGGGYLPEYGDEDPPEYDGATVCPGCAPKHGLALTARIAAPPWESAKPAAHQRTPADGPTDA